MQNDHDGSLIVRFTAGGTREMCWHLFTWGRRGDCRGPREPASWISPKCARGWRSIIGRSPRRRETTPDALAIGPDAPPIDGNGLPAGARPSRGKEGKDNGVSGKSRRALRPLRDRQRVRPLRAGRGMGRKAPLQDSLSRGRGLASHPLEGDEILAAEDDAQGMHEGVEKGLQGGRRGIPRQGWNTRSRAPESPRSDRRILAAVRRALRSARTSCAAFSGSSTLGGTGSCSGTTGNRSPCSIPATAAGDGGSQRRRSTPGAATGRKYRVNREELVLFREIGTGLSWVRPVALERYTRARRSLRTE